MLYIFSIIVALFIGFVVIACIFAPDLCDHEACKPLPGEGDEVTGRQGDSETQHIDIAA